MPVSLLIFLLVPEAAKHKSTWKSLKFGSCSVMPACASAPKASVDAAELHGMIADWQSAGCPDIAGLTGVFVPPNALIAVKPNVVSADVLFENSMLPLKWEWVASGSVRAPLR